MTNDQPPQAPPPPSQPSRRPLPPLEKTSSGRPLLKWIIVIVVLAAAIAGGAFGISSMLGGNGDEAQDEPTPTTAPPTADPAVAAEEALRGFVMEQLQKEYAGDCGTSILPTAEGRVCSVAKGERDGRRAFIIGTSSFEFTHWVFLEPAEGGWRVYQTLPVKPESAGVPGAPWPLKVGAKVVAAGTSDCLNVRVAPGLKEAAVDCLTDGTEIVLAEGPVEMDGFQWWRPEDRSGWVAGDWLRYPEEVQGLQPATPTPAP